jgi:hypothetical protein
MSKSTKSVVLTLRISEEEQAQLRERAEVNHQTVSEFVRGVVQDRITPTRRSTTGQPRLSRAPGNIWASTTTMGQTTSARWVTESSMPQPNQQTLVIRATSGS